MIKLNIHSICIVIQIIHMNTVIILFSLHKITYNFK